MRACDLNLCIDLHRPRQIPALPASRSCRATPSTIPLNRVGCPRAPHLQRPNPHRARCTTAAHFPRFRPLEVFVRRPQECVAPPSWAGIRKPYMSANLSRPFRTAQVVSFCSTPPELILPSRPAVSQGRRAQGQSRMAVALIVPRAARFPGHSLTGLVRDGRLERVGSRRP